MTGPECVLVTGGCGFIGSNFIRYLFGESGFRGRVINVDKLTYAGNPANLAEIESGHGGGRYLFERADIADQTRMSGLLQTFPVDLVVHFAAESHVDRSILGPGDFVRTNILGTFSMLEAVRIASCRGRRIRFHHVSTDEVYGSLGPAGKFPETAAYDPKSPYSATKAAADHLVRAFAHTYGLDVTISNCSNNFGPYQHPEKFIPLMICNMLEGRPLPVFGDGRNVRDWLHVRDHCDALWIIAREGDSGETYNVGGENERYNIDLLRHLCGVVAALTGKGREQYEKLIVFVPDRPGHDRRYALDCRKIRRDLGWKPSVDFGAALGETVAWYLENPDWIATMKSASRGVPA